MDLIARSLIKAVENKVNVLVYCSPDYLAQSMVYFNELAAQGISCEYSLADSLVEAMDYARDRSIPWVHVVSDTISKREVKK